MYQEIIDNLVIPFPPEEVKGFNTHDNAFYIELKDGKEQFKAFDLTESLTRKEFHSICLMLAKKLTT
ncbi:hypothetical protein [Polynucleobacter sp.]|uniref:hypothetical protein n=1 Tax=Polynucleobacter sp. TaxID=2029855 RepID=UPI003F69C3E7